jgi:hypothetical protein
MGKGWTGFIWEKRKKWQVLVEAAVNLQVQSTVGNFLIN